MIPEKIELNRKDVLAFIAIIVGIGNKEIKMDEIRNSILAILVRSGLKAEDIPVAVREMKEINKNESPLQGEKI
jgi:hypothetical protein